MTRRDRLMATLRGEPVDRPAVSFYEITGFEDQSDADPYNVHSDPSWRPLIELAREATDRIVMRGVGYASGQPDPVALVAERQSYERNGSRFTVLRVHAGDRILTERRRRDKDVDTVWTEEHLLKSADDLRAYLAVLASGGRGSQSRGRSGPGVDVGTGDKAPGGTVATNEFLAIEETVGDSGIVMIDTSDPLCRAASLFCMADYTVIALTEQSLFRELLDRFAEELLAKTEAVATALPGRLWRIFGPEYASPPYLPPHLFREYVCRYVTPMVRAIQRHGGFARIHSHGNLKAILDDIAGMGADGLDPIEPPPQGDVELRYVRERYGKDMVLFGNLEASDIENLPTPQFAERVRRALDEGTAGDGRGFVLMPSSCPYGRRLSPLALRNYETMIEIALA